MGVKRFLAFDLGAESGRAILGTLSEGRLALEEIRRFPNEPVEVCGTLHWDVLSLYNNILKGMGEYARRYGDSVDGIGIDTWALDFGLLGADGKLLGNPVHYRDRRTEGMAEVIASRMPIERVYGITGINMLSIYTLSQLVALRERQPEMLAFARKLLMMPDLLGYFLTGEEACDRTVAITSEVYDPRGGTWSAELFAAMKLPLHIMPRLVDPGTVIGELLPSVSAATGLAHAKLIVPCTHDTGSAVAAVGADGDDWAFISSGTWSVLGMLSGEVITDEAAFRAGVCNELTVDSRFVCRNIMGLWLLQQARAGWARGGEELSYPELAQLAAQAPEDGPLVYPDAAEFLAPPDMLEAIGGFCAGTGQQPPEGVAGYARCILESLAMCYRQSLEQMEQLTDRRAARVHVVGGGSRNAVLCQYTANATGRVVIAGPAEATVTGNILVQALAVGAIGSPEEMREICRRSVERTEYAPQQTQRWEARYQEYLALLCRDR